MVFIPIGILSFRALFSLCMFFPHRYTSSILGIVINSLQVSHDSCVICQETQALRWTTQLLPMQDADVPGSSLSFCISGW